MGSQFVFAPREDDSIIRQRLLTRASVTRGEPPMKKLLKKLMALAAEAAKPPPPPSHDGAAAAAATADGGASGPAGATGGAGGKGAGGGGVGGSVEECERAARLFLLELAAFEQPLLKTRAVIAANRKEQQMFRDMQVDLSQQIEKAQADISRLKRELAHAQALRRHEEECEVVRAQICMQPPRAQTEAAIATLETELSVLERENLAATCLLDLRRKQFALLLLTVEELQQVVESGPVDLNDAILGSADAGLYEALGRDVALLHGRNGRRAGMDSTAMDLDWKEKTS